MVEGLRLRKLPHLKPIEMATVKEDEDEPLSPMARMFHRPDSNMYIICMLGLKKKVFWTDVLKDNLLRNPFLKHPRFSCLLVMDGQGGEMKWVQTEIDIEKHIIVPDLNQEEIDRLSSADKFIEDYISNLSKTTIDMSKPLWDIHILNLKHSEKEEEAEAVAILRVHHSLGDGISLMSLLFATARKTSDQTALPTIPGQEKKAAPKYSSKLGGRGGFGYGLRKIWNTIVDVFMFSATKIWLLRDTQTPLKGHMRGGGVESSTPRRIVHRSASLDDVKLVKNAMNATINDVLIGIIQAGLSRYLNRKYGELVKKDESTRLWEEKNYLPKNIRMRALVIKNIRPSPGIHALAYMMEKGTKARWGNQIGGVIFPLTIALRRNPLDYVRDAKVGMDRKKASFEAQFSSFICMLALKFVNKVASFRSHTTMWFSNIVGPQEEISLFGSSIVYIGATCYGQPTGLMIHAISYINKIRFILSVDESTVPDPHQLCDDIEESLNHIKEAVIAGEEELSTPASILHRY